jgi:hypothetical protein
MVCHVDLREVLRENVVKLRKGEGRRTDLGARRPSMRSDCILGWRDDSRTMGRANCELSEKVIQ